ncbi:4-(cytidine 5'-diphospho)-2-C-methyl-D-erythritol kinase [Tardiphaga sp. P9-11]|jgi:4-diphosphocytidyl-2-C-methyl-D-erythritol kinase|uniref:4-(cytidine 5'-diphospho)-2-C-methyl-D-erythritol kinase n=1 Tax=Tardiphaga sp. P9-11 TaxID=2024614 RepID=UPI0011F12229|nr:4-(cytidine 5'-diphospho)-2-C-methyl-D-erythritol kinase [Tardiphaga sp. P9-11]KAA0078550.1 4-(cytidine 5'-diphospho)-2-C-methyl-D-erythritol kinase [Tardiphaga sp. P9-11]
MVGGTTGSSKPVLEEDARAKVNLTLRVIGRRADGYHDLESVVAFADCADRLMLDVGGDLSLTATGPRAQECGDTADNLVIKAARLLGERVDGLTFGRFALDKHLPVAAGIGGGSADAAAALRLLARANNLEMDDPRVLEVARLTGADVPVCVPSHACVMTGVGENLLPLSIPRLPCVMVNPRVPVATKDVFKELGLKNGELRVGVKDVLKRATWPNEGSSIDAWISALNAGTNDLEAPALKVEPVIDTVLSALRDAEGVRLARMSGSGATCFALFGNDTDAQRAAGTIQLAHPLWWVHAGALS